MYWIGWFKFISLIVCIIFCKSSLFFPDTRKVSVSIFARTFNFVSLIVLEIIFKVSLSIPCITLIVCLKESPDAFSGVWKLKAFWSIFLRLKFICKRDYNIEISNELQCYVRISDDMQSQ